MELDAHFAQRSDTVWRVSWFLERDIAVEFSHIFFLVIYFHYIWENADMFNIFGIQKLHQNNLDE